MRLRLKLKKRTLPRPLTSLLPSLFAAITITACAKPESFTSNTANQNQQLASSSDSDIIGGEVVSGVDPIASTVVAIYDTEQKGLCTGSIISSSLVITAGHCFNQDPTKLVLIFGTQLPMAGQPKPALRRVVDGRLNPRYAQVNALLKRNQNLNPDALRDWGDISLLKFSGGLPPGYAPAQLLTNAASLQNGAWVTLAGYGEVDGKKHIGSNGLGKVDVTIADAKFSATEVQMDQRNGKGACHGDSGGPAYVTVGGKKLLFGVTSRGSLDKNNDCSQFSIYSNILTQMQWVSEQSKALAEAKPPAQNSSSTTTVAATH